MESATVHIELSPRSESTFKPPLSVIVDSSAPTTSNYRLLSMSATSIRPFEERADPPRLSADPAFYAFVRSLPGSMGKKTLGGIFLRTHHKPISIQCPGCWPGLSPLLHIGASISRLPLMLLDPVPHHFLTFAASPVPLLFHSPPLTILSHCLPPPTHTARDTDCINCQSSTRDLRHSLLIQIH